MHTRFLFPTFSTFRLLIGLLRIYFWQDFSKARHGGLESFRRPFKVTQAFALDDCPERCPVRLYDLYNGYCPADRPDDAFYLRPRTKYDLVWYDRVAVGKNTLGSVVGNLCRAAGFEGHFSNHSLRATAATRLFDADIDEQLIKSKTGHTSDAVRSYKRISETKLANLTDTIAGGKKLKAQDQGFEPEVSNVSTVTATSSIDPVHATTKRQVSASHCAVSDQFLLNGPETNISVSGSGVTLNINIYK